MEIVKNKRTYHDYKISETFEAGLVLSGPEVKSIKKGSISLKGAYISIDQNMEAYLVNAHIAAYKPAKTHQKEYNPEQPRKLLLNKNLSELLNLINLKGSTIYKIGELLSRGGGGLIFRRVILQLGGAKYIGDNSTKKS